MACVQPDAIADQVVKEQIAQRSAGYSNVCSFFVAKLSQGIGMIAAAFYPRPVTVRLSDFKSHEYKELLGGSYFEPEEANPMLGLRGASRYYHPAYQAAFALECQAFVHARYAMGFDNIQLLVPFVRTVDEALIVLDLLAKHGLQQGKNGLKILMMCELPANALLMEQFSTLFDGFSIGSNDLAQCTLGIDRDEARVQMLFDESNEAVKKLCVMAITGAHQHDRYISICGQGPSDDYAFARFLIDQGIDALSLNVDAVLPFLMKQES
jgi:pyruvate,water dikinase